ncbi:MAG: hypothetical protein JO323_12765 [Acidobacteriia bacterium]|nr:hypothetical protein [Terriglobia bacterium]
MRRLPLPTIFAAVLCPAALFGEMHVEGLVTNQNEVPVAGCLVMINDVSLARTWETVSDPTGVFRLDPAQVSTLFAWITKDST